MPPGAITGPSAWYGRDLAGKESEWLRHFSASELVELDAAVRAFRASGAPLAAISPASFPLPALGAILRDVLRELLELW